MAVESEPEGLLAFYTRNQPDTRAGLVLLALMGCAAIGVGVSDLHNSFALFAILIGIGLIVLVLRSFPSLKQEFSLFASGMQVNMMGELTVHKLSAIVAITYVHQGEGASYKVRTSDGVDYWIPWDEEGTSFAKKVALTAGLPIEGKSKY